MSNSFERSYLRLTGISLHLPRMLAAALVLVLTAACSDGDGMADAGATGGATGAAAGGSGGPTDGSAGDSGGGSSTGSSGSGGANGSGNTGSSSTSGGNGSNSGALVNPAPGSDLFMGANFWNIDWEGSQNYFQNGVDFATTTNPWKPELLADLAPYHVLRFMDWNDTNVGSNPRADWNARKLPTEPQSNPVAFEWQIDLCNRTHTDYWVTVPSEADLEYWTELAKLVQRELDPSLRVYVEWSNEVWNGAFPQADYAASHGQALSLSGDDPGSSYYVYQSVRLFEAFEAVFGANDPRLVKVLSGFAAWSGVCERHIAALADSVINPNDTMPDVYAIAPYFFGTSVSSLANSVPTAVDWARENTECIGTIGLPLISYEGGADAFAAGDGCTQLQHDQGMYQVYSDFLDGLADHLKGPFVHYTHSGACWGLKESTSDSLDASPKYRAVVDWIASHPQP